MCKWGIVVTLAIEKFGEERPFFRTEIKAMSFKAELQVQEQSFRALLGMYQAMRHKVDGRGWW